MSFDPDCICMNYNDREICTPNSYFELTYFVIFHSFENLEIISSKIIV